MLEEIAKLSRVRQIGLPADLFAGYSERLVSAWRARAVACYPSDLLASPPAVRLTLLAALCWSRTSEITDALVDLLIRLVLKINTRAEKKVEKAIYAEFKQVHGKTGILFRLAEAPSSIPMRRCARRCTRWSVRRHCGIWWPRPRPTSRCSGPGFVRC